MNKFLILLCRYSKLSSSEKVQVWQKYQLVLKREMLMWILLHYLPQGASKIFPFCSCSQRPNTLIYVHFLFEWWALKCFIQIGVQNPTTINAFTDAQKFIIILVIPKGFGSCLTREKLQHSSFSFHCAGFERLLRTWASWLQRQISICTLNHHSESQTYFLSLVIAYNSDSRLQS